MKITALQEYGVRCIYQLALQSNDHPQTTSSIAKKEGLSRDYVEKILFQLRKSDIVHSVRGIHGGYVLSRASKDISLGEIVQALSEKPVRSDHVKEDLCKQFPGKDKQCVHLGGCVIRSVWTLVITQMYEILNQFPLSFLLGSEAEVAQRLKDA